MVVKRILQTSLIASSLLFALPALAKPKAAANVTETSAKRSNALLRGVGTHHPTKRNAKANKNATRSTKAQIGSATMALSVDEGVSNRRVQSEDTVSAAATTRSQIMAKQKKSPHDAALAAMKDKAREIAPKGKGRIRISYTIGMQGKPTNVMVLGYSNKVDDALADILEGWQMPRNMAGQMISTRVDMAPALAKSKSKRKKRSRKRVASKR